MVAAPPCQEHAGSKVIRNGTYGVRTPRPRQRYRCFPADGSKPHSFTPALPREHVHPAEGGCPECEELRGVHHGETAVARRHSWPTRLVARALAQLSQGGSYADTSRQALRSAERIANRHEELVRSGLTVREADAVVEAEEAARDRGGRQPRLVAAYATILARTGGEETLERAIKVCDEALGRWAQNTADGWPELRAKRGQLAGRLTRLRGRLSSELDEDGNPIPVRRHHPADPRRVRGRRFGLPG